MKILLISQILLSKNHNKSVDCVALDQVVEIVEILYKFFRNIDLYCLFTN